MLGTAAQAMRLGKLEAPSRSTTRPGGALVVPPILPLDAWERLAVAAQGQLANKTREGVA
jgi:hypothetical protein